MNNGRNKGIGDYLILAILGSIWSFDKFGLAWYGFKAVIALNVIIIMYAVLSYIIESIRK